MTKVKPSAGRMWAFSAAVLGLVLAAQSVPAVQAAPPAQAGAEVHVHRVSTQEVRDANGNPALSVRVIYSLGDSEGRAMVDAEQIAGTSLLMQNRPVQVQATPDEPMDKDKWNIVLLTDFSRASASDTGKELLAARVAMATQLEKGPESAFYAWYDFNETLLPQQREFKSLNSKNPADTNSNKDDTIPKKLAAARSVPLKTVCLYNVLIDAITQLQQPAISGKKAVLLLTHQGHTCNNAAQAAMVIQQANAGGNELNQVQIFAAGLGGPPLKAALDTVTQDTGGVAFVNDGTAIEPTIAQLLTAMKGQRQSHFVTYPEKGQQTARMTVQLNDGTSKSVDISLAPPVAYKLPPALVFLNAASLPVGLQLIFDCVSADQFKQLKIQLFSDGVPEPVYSQDILQVGDMADGKGKCFWTISRQQGAKELKEGVPFELRVYFVLNPGETKPLIADGKWPQVRFNPKPPAIKIVDAREPTKASAKFVVTVTTDLDLTSVDVLLFNTLAGEQPVALPQRLMVSNGQQGQVEIPVGNLPEGTYKVQAVWTGVANVNDTWPNVLVYRKATALENIGQSLRENDQSRLAAIGIGVAAVLLIIFLVWFIRMRSVSQIKVVRGEGMGEQRMRRIQVNVPNTGLQSSQGGGPRSSQVPAAEAVAATASNAPKTFQTAVPPRPSTLARAGGKPPESGATNLPMATVRVRKPEAVVFRGRIKKTPFKIGRDAGNDGVLPVESSSGVSRHHISILFEGGQWFVRDEGTANGTRVNGARIAPNQPVLLNDGAVLALGSVEIEFQVQAAGGANKDRG